MSEILNISTHSHLWFTASLKLRKNKQRSRVSSIRTMDINSRNLGQQEEDLDKKKFRKRASMSRSTLHHTRPRGRIITESRGRGGEDELPCAGQQLTLQPRRAEHAAHPAECPGRPPAPGPPPPRWPRCSTSPRSPCYQQSTVLTTLSQLTARTPGPGPTPPPAPVRQRREQY